jgi:HK97 family phage major capsid protein
MERSNMTKTQVNALAADIGQVSPIPFSTSLQNRMWPICDTLSRRVFAIAPATNVEGMRTRQQELADASEALFTAAQEGGRDLTDDELAQIEGNAAEAERLGRQILARERVDQLSAGTGRRTAPDGAGGAGGGTGVRAVPATARTDPRTCGFRHLGEFAACVFAAAAQGDRGAEGRLMAMGEGTGEDGGFLVPPEFREGIMKVVEGEDSLLSRCDGSTTVRNSVVQNIDENTPWGTSGIQVYWEGEGQAATSTGLKPGQTTLRLNKLFARVDVTDELLEDAPQLDNYLRVKTPEVMTSVINLAIISGSGVGKPQGFMGSNALVTVDKEISQPADSVYHHNIVHMWERMYAPCRARAIWLINQDVESQFELMSFRDGSAFPVPIYIPVNGLSGTPYSTLKGRPIIPVQGMESLGDLGDIALVDLTMYRIITKTGGARVDTSIHLKFDTDETVYRFIFRLAGAPWWSKPIQPRVGGNTLSAFVALASRE